MCVCVCEWMYVCVRERHLHVSHGGEGIYVCEREWMYVCVRERVDVCVCERERHLHVSHGGEWIGAEVEAPELHQRGQIAKVREVAKFVVGHVERVEGGGEVVREGGDGREDVAAEAERLLTIYFTMLIDYIAIF
jgi:hypothetical protein